MNDHEDEADELDDNFKVWECPNCKWVMSNDAYMQIAVEINCPHCHGPKLGQFRSRMMYAS